MNKRLCGLLMIHHYILAERLSSGNLLMICSRCYALKAKITERRKWLESEYDRNAENAEIRYEVEAHLNELNRIDAWLNHPALDAAASEES
jgi:hypothetical protein